MTPQFFEMLKERLDATDQGEGQLKGVFECGQRCGPQDCSHPQLSGHRGDLQLTSLSVQSWEGHHLQVCHLCRAIIDEFMGEHLTTPTTPEEWTELEAEFKLRWNVPHTIGASMGSM